MNGMDMDMDGKQSCVHGWHEETRTEEGNVALLIQGEWVHGKAFPLKPTCMHTGKRVARSLMTKAVEVQTIATWMVRQLKKWEIHTFCDYISRRTHHI